MDRDRLQGSAVPPLVEIVRQCSSGLGIAPREAATSRAARATFPFCLGRQALSRPFTAGVCVIPIDVDHRMVLEDIGDDVSPPKSQRLVPWMLRNSVTGCLDELQVPAVGHLLDVRVEDVPADPALRILGSAPSPSSE